MDENDRASLKAELAELDKAEDAIRTARKPFDDAIMAVETVRSNLLEKHDVEIAGSCEACSRLLFIGDMGYRYEDCTVCEACAPSYADAEENWSKNDDKCDAEDKAAFLSTLAAHLAAGGSRSDKLPACEL